MDEQREPEERGELLAQLLSERVRAEQHQPRLEILPSGTQVTRSVGSNLALTCKPAVPDTRLVSQLEWFDPKGIKIENTIPEAELYIQSLPGEPGIVLIFSKIKKNSEGTYTCTAKYANTEDMKTNITVNTIVEITWIDAPENQFPKVGEDYKVRCEVQANPPPTVEWIRNNEVITPSDRYIIDNKGLLIKKVKESDDGVYTCRAVVLDTGEIQIRNIKVEVQIPPRLESIDNVELTEGQTASVECKAFGKPPPSYTWIKESTREDLSSTDRFTVKRNQGLLTFNRVESNDNSNYTCIAKNSAGEDQITIEVKVLVPARIYELLNVTAPVGQDTKIICKANGRPTPSVTFRKLSNNDPFTLGPQQNRREVILEQNIDESKEETFGELSISKLRRTDDGLYECIAENKAGRAVKNGHITVQFPPTFERTEGYPPVWTWGDRPANLSCIAESIPNATIEWKFGDYIISKNTTNMIKIGNGPQSSLIVTPSGDPRFFNKYECIASNQLGRNSTFIELRQATVPGPVQQVRINSLTATTIKFNIVGPQNFHGLPLRRFLVQYQTERERDWNSARNHSWTVDAPYILENLEPEVTYNFRFAAINDVGIGGWGGNQQVTMPRRSVPAEPRVLISNESEEEVINSPCSDGFDLRWNVPNDNGDPIDSYIIKYCVTERINGEWRDDSESCSESTQSFQYTSYELKSLKPDTVYKIELSAHNAIGFSTPAQIRVKTARDMDSMIPHQETTISSAMIIGIVVAAVIVLLLVVDIICCCVNRAGILALLLEKIKSKPADEEDPKLGRDEKEPLKSENKDQQDFMNTTDRRNMSVEFDGKRVYSRSGDIIIGKNSAV